MRVKVLTPCVETRPVTRVRVLSGGVARYGVAPTLSVLITRFRARTVASFLTAIQTVQRFMAHEIYKNDPETQLHPLEVGHFLKILHYFSSAGALYRISY